MHLDESVTVPVPEHKIAYKTVSGKKYVYYTIACYRNAQGKPTNDRVSIGKLDEETGLLIPNRNYYEIYLKQVLPIQGGIHNYGVYYAFYHICETLGITKILKKLFPEHYKEILTVAQYMLTEGNTMYYLEDYIEEHETSIHGLMDDKKCSKIFASIRPEDVLLFFREWLKHRKTDEYIAYDVTSIPMQLRIIFRLLHWYILFANRYIWISFLHSALRLFFLRQFLPSGAPSGFRRF